MIQKLHAYKLTTLLLFVVVLLLLTANYLFAQWANPPANPPNDNTPAPVNVGSVMQTKEGTLRANQYWSDNYCDWNGENCGPTP